MTDTMMNISLCICTYNRADQLKKTLESILLSKSELIYGDEILVIDNNSNDGTQKVADNFTAKLPLSYFFEPTQGLSAARNKGLSEFKNPFIIFIDDDVTVTSGFIDEYRQAFESNSDKGFFGGKIHIDWGGQQPSWYKSTNLPMINGFLGYYDQGESNQNFNPNDLLPYGANFALRKELVQKVGLFNKNLGVQGKQIGRGEETEYFRRALEQGFEGVYIAGIKAYHRFQMDRIALKYLYNYGVQKGIAAVKLDSAMPNHQFRKITYQCFAGVYQLFKLRVDRFYQCVINVGLIRGISAGSKLVNNSDDD